MAEMATPLVGIVDLLQAFRDKTIVDDVALTEDVVPGERATVLQESPSRRWLRIHVVAPKDP
jgi:hypothetical protein